jgi:KH domain-containing protein
MKTLQIENISRILINKKELETKLKVELDLKANNLVIKGDSLDEYIAERVIQAIELGFSTKTALILLDEDYMLETISIKDLSKKNPRVIRARIIGTKRKTLDTIEEISNCDIVLHDNTIGVIGHSDDIKGAMQALMNLVKGTKPANVYSYLEKLNARKLPFVLSLKKKKTKEE